jgi:thiamine biosynthesis lipoprotein
LLWVAFWLSSAPDADAQLRRYEYSADAMGGTFSIALYAAARRDADEAAAAAFSELRRLDALLSNYRPESAWSEVNRDAGRRAVRVPQEVFDVISASIDFSRRTDGAFDITIGPLIRAWGFRDGAGALASDAVVQDARERVGYANVRLDARSRTVRFARAGIELDPGGIGKGYAVDRMAGVLRARGIDRALVSAAGSSIYALGAPPGAEGWPATLRAARTGSGASRVLLKDESLSTSGAAGKSFRDRGRLYGHVIDPRTGYPARGFLASVIAPRTIESEAWTKAILLNGRAWSREHTPQNWRVFYCETADAGSCGWLP